MWIEVASEGIFPDGYGSVYEITKEVLEDLKRSVEGKDIVWDIGHALSTSDNIGLSKEEAEKVGLVHGYSKRAEVRKNRQGKYALYVDKPKFSKEALLLLKENKKPYPSIAFTVRTIPELHSISLVSSPNIPLPPIMENSNEGRVNSERNYKNSIIYVNTKQPIDMMMVEETEKEKEFRVLAILCKIYNKEVADVLAGDIEDFLSEAYQNASILSSYWKEKQLEKAKEEEEKAEEKNTEEAVENTTEEEEEQVVENSGYLSEKKKNTKEEEEKEKVSPPRINVLQNAKSLLDKKVKVFINSQYVSELLEKEDKDKRDFLRDILKANFVSKMLEGEDEMKALLDTISSYQVFVNSKVQRPFNIEKVFLNSNKSKEENPSGIKEIYSKMSTNSIWHTKK